MRPLGQRECSVLFKNVATVEVTILVDVVADLGMGGGKFAYDLCIPGTCHCIFPSVERRSEIPDSIVELPTVFPIASFATTFVADWYVLGRYPVRISGPRATSVTADAHHHRVTDRLGRTVYLTEGNFQPRRLRNSTPRLKRIRYDITMTSYPIRRKVRKLSRAAALAELRQFAD